MPAKKPSGKRVSVKAFGAFDARALPVDVAYSPSDFTKWQRDFLSIRPITISYTIPGASRVQK